MRKNSSLALRQVKFARAPSLDIQFCGFRTPQVTFFEKHSYIQKSFWRKAFEKILIAFEEKPWKKSKMSTTPPLFALSRQGPPDVRRRLLRRVKPHSTQRTVRSQHCLTPVCWWEPGYAACNARWHEQDAHFWVYLHQNNFHKIPHLLMDIRYHTHSKKTFTKFFIHLCICGICAHGVRIEMDIRYSHPQSVRWTDTDFFASLGTHTHRAGTELMPIFLHLD
jgi:hypothetical protein